MSEPSTDELARAKRELLFEINEEQFQMWRHERITASVLQFMQDQIAQWRELAADFVEWGAFHLGDQHEDRNPDVVRGKLLAMRQLHQITLEGIQAFYSQAASDEEQTGEPPREDEE